MPSNPRIIYTETDKTLMWDRWVAEAQGWGLPFPGLLLQSLCRCASHSKSSSPNGLHSLCAS